MTPPKDNSPTGAGRDALTQSERKAAERQPDSFKEEAITEKVVEIPPLGSTDKPIEGLDPK
ncbi:MAG TPA: hypothetical protein VF319_15565 [Caldimonas sp.]